MIRKITEFFYNLKWFFKNLIFFRKVLWRNRPYDYIYLFYSLKEQIRYMLRHHMKYSIFEDKEETIKDMRRAIVILTRLYEESYFKETFDYKKAEEKAEEDLDKLLKLFKEKIFRWWE